MRSLFALVGLGAIALRVLDAGECSAQWVAAPAVSYYAPTVVYPAGYPAYTTPAPVVYSSYYAAPAVVPAYTTYYAAPAYYTAAPVAYYYPSYRYRVRYRGYYWP